jgi:Restriction Enzyme Adenine Methylase Associated
VPLFELSEADELVPFRRVHASAEVYAREIGDLAWKSFEELIGEPLFRVARRPSLPVGQPDVVALDEQARVVVVNVRRDLDRGELAQGLEFAGWARTTNLDELAAIYHRGSEAFFGDWQTFTDSTASERVRRPPRLVFIARGFHPRTEPAFEFLVEHSLPVRAVRVALYEDLQGRRYVDVEGDEAESGGEGAVHGGTAAREEAMLEARGIRLTDLLEGGYVSSGDRLVWARPGTGEIYNATLTDNGCIKLEDGRVFSGPSRAATEVAGIAAYDGWQAWRVGGADGELLDHLRVRLIRRWAEIEGEPTNEVEDNAQRETTTELEERADGRADGDSSRDAPADGAGDPQGVA